MHSHDIDRRQFLAVGLAAAAAPWLRTRHALELTGLSLREAAAAMRSGDLKATTYATALLERAETLASLNPFRSLDPHGVLAAARAADKRLERGLRPGPLHGLPLVIKDNINTTTLTTSAGTPALARNRPRRNAVVVDRLLAAGAIVLGKANMHELALGVTSNNAAFGAVRNPYDADLIAGGSSGGNGCAIGARIAPGGIGTDTAGSVRIPAALCGLAALRPTVGRYPVTGTDIVPISHTRDVPGPMARTVADVALLDAVITCTRGHSRPRDLRDVRLGVDRSNFFADLDPGVAVIVEEVLDRVRLRGATLVEIEMPELPAINAAVGIPVAAFEMGEDLPRYLKANETGVSFDDVVAQVASPDVRALLGLIPTISQDVYDDALLVQRPKLQALYREAFRTYGLDALVFPTTPVPARPVGDDETIELNGRRVPTFLTYIRHTDPGSNAGLPGLSIPAGLTPEGLPVGVEIDGAPGCDRALLALGLAIERVLQASE